MNELTYSQLIAENRKLASQFSGEPFQILIVSNTVVDNLKEFIEYDLRSQGINAQVETGSFDNLLQQTQDVKQQVLIVFMETWNLSPGLYTRTDLNDGFFLSLEENIKQQIGTLTQNTRHLPLVIFNTFNNILDCGLPFRATALKTLANNLNQFLESLQVPNLFIFDTRAIFQKLSEKEAFSISHFYHFNTLYSNSFFRIYSHYLKFVIFSLTGKAKKALIMDCDNTIWKGIVGEDGTDGIQMDYNSPEGRPFFEVQKMIVSLSQQGVIIGLCSKNNPDDVQKIIDSHPDMALRDENIVIKKINWEPKHENLINIARELNIGTDSLVFWDDSDFEIRLMSELLPEVLCFKVPEKVYDYPTFFREQLGWFFKREVTREDLEKTQQYKFEAGRKQEQQKFASISDYIRSLSLEIVIESHPNKYLDRIAQLSQKTNQFNLSVKRYTPTDITALMDSKNHEIMAFHVNDRFGNYGLTGLCIIRFQDTQAWIDTLLMSCRILGRELENAFMNYLISHLKAKNIQTIRAEYIKTQKNMQIVEFLSKTGFQPEKESFDKIIYICQTNQFKPFDIDYIKIIHNDEAKRNT